MGNPEVSYRGRIRDAVIILAFGLTLIQPVGMTTTIISLAVLILGTLLHVATKATLIRNNVLCQEGVYTICRHPYYLSNFLVDMSFCLLSGNIYLVAAYPFLFFWSYGAAFKSEEAMLAKIHGQAFNEFVLRTPQVFPSPASMTQLRTIPTCMSLSRVSTNEWVRLSRFWMVAVALMLVNELRFEHDWLKGKSFTADLDTIVMAAAVALFAVLTVVLHVISRRQRKASKH